MLTVALIGADGAGKTTVCRQLEQRLPMPVKSMYMGIHFEASRFVLPTTRLILAIKRWRGKPAEAYGPPDPERSRPHPKGLLRQTAATLKSALRLTNQVAEEWFRQILAWHYVRRGYVVLFDRHFFVDYYFHDIVTRGRKRPWHRRLHGFMLNRFYPRPDLTILLDASPEVLFARKGEGTLELLDRRRREYHDLESLLKDFCTVDAALPLNQVTRRIGTLIREAYEAKTAAKRNTAPRAVPTRTRAEER